MRRDPLDGDDVTSAHLEGGGDAAGARDAQPPSARPLRSAPRLHHVQVAMPVGGEDEARAFWRDRVGLTEVPKPEPMAARGGCWFRAYDDAGAVVVEIHMGREDPFVPARKAHPAIVVASIVELERLGASIADGGYEVVWTDRLTFPGYERFHCFDGFGNRVEVLAASA